MEADWEVEIGPGAPVVDAAWDGFVDLQRNPERAYLLPEAAAFPALADALIRLNSNTSPVWTAKCDIWSLHDSSGHNPSALDPYELECAPGSALFGWAIYIDLLPTGKPLTDQHWIDPGHAISWCKQLCVKLHALQIACCRVDLIVRSAIVEHGVETIGVTAYVTAAGPDAEQAKRVLHRALLAFADAASSTQR